MVFLIKLLIKNFTIDISVMNAKALSYVDYLVLCIDNLYGGVMRCQDTLCMWAPGVLDRLHWMVVQDLIQTR